MGVETIRRLVVSRKAVLCLAVLGLIVTSFLSANAGTGCERDVFREGGENLGMKAAGGKPDYRPLRRQVEAYIEQTGQPYGICFLDLHSGSGFGINETVPMVAASTTKVPVVLYLYQLAAEGKINWNEPLAYNGGSDFESGAGVLEFEARPGDKYSLRTLATLAITTSDNIAYRMLMRRLGHENVYRFMRSLGGQTVFPNGRNITTAADLVKYMEAVLRFAQEHQEEGNRLLDDMAHSIYHVGLPGRLPETMTVPHKEGQIDDVANDFGVIYTPRPFILAVLSSGNSSIDEGFARIAEITRLCYDYQVQLEKDSGSR